VEKEKIMTKLAINNHGQQVEVSDDTPVKTVNGVHYLHTEPEQLELDARNAEWEAGAKDRHNTQVGVYRQSAYTRESDHIMYEIIEKQALGESVADLQAALTAKKTEIRNQYPYEE
jgi:hypothetical protein